MFSLALVGMTIAVLTPMTALQQASTDCTTELTPEESIQSAIDEAEAGAVICLGEGTWTEHVTIEKRLTLRGAGAESSVVEANEEDRPVVQISSSEEIEVAIETLTVTGASDDDGIRVVGSAQATIQNSTVSENFIGIELRDSAQATITDSTVSRNDDGILLVDSAQATIRNSTVSKNGTEFSGSGITLEDSAQAEIRDSAVSENGGFRGGIDLGGSTQATITGSTVSENEGDGILLTGSAQATITGSTVSESAIGGIRLFGSAQATIRDSTVSANEVDGIQLFASAQATIRNSTVSANGSGGIRLFGSAQATIRDNRIEGNTQAGINLTSEGEVEGSGNVMADNGVDLWGNVPGSLREPLVEPTEESVVYPNEDHPTLQHAVDALRPGGELLLQEGTHTAGLTITKEFTVQAQGGADVTLQAKNSDVPVFSLVGGAALTATGIQVTDGDRGLVLGADAEVMLRDSTVSENESDGIELDGSAQATISDNRIEGNTGAAIASTSEGDVEGSGNVMSDNGVALEGNVPGNLREPLAEATEEQIIFPNEDHPTLQHAVDALQPGGELILENGEFTAGVTIAKELTIAAQEGAEATLKGKGAAVLSLVEEANLTAMGLTVTGGQTGFRLGADAQTTLTNSTVIENEDDGIALGGSAQATIRESTVSENESDGIELRDSAQATITDSTVSRNDDGISLVGSTEATITDSTVSENSNGIWLADSAQATLENNEIMGNEGILKREGYGIILSERPCFDTDSKFRGRITGKQNTIPGPEASDGNGEGAVCPSDELKFLMTDEGGELDRRE